MKRNRFVIIICFICAMLMGALGVNLLFKIKSSGLLSAEWEAGDALNYVGTVIAAFSTFLLGLIAYEQNKKLQSMEDNNYIAANNCMVLIDEIKIIPQVRFPTGYRLFSEQILKEVGNKDEIPSGYKISVRLKKAGSSIQATPSLIYVSGCLLIVGDGEGGTSDAIEIKNIREGYTRVAITEDDVAFDCWLLVSRDRQKKFGEDIKRTDNKIIVEMEFCVVTDKYVMTKCKCRSYCICEIDITVTWRSMQSQTYFYGHELKNRDEIKVLEIQAGKAKNA